MPAIAWLLTYSVIAMHLGSVIRVNGAEYDVGAYYMPTDGVTECPTKECNGSGRQTLLLGV